MRQGARIWVILGVFGAAATVVFILLTVRFLQVAAGVMLGVFALSMLYIAWVLYAGRYTDPTEQPEAEAEVGPQHVFPPSWAPPLLALGVAVTAVGVRFTLALVGVGGTLIVLTLFSWVVQRVDVQRMLHATTPHAGLGDPPELAADPPPAAAPGSPAPGTPGLGSPRIGHDNA